MATDDNGIETATDGGTVHSYDPYKASRIMDGPAASHAKITVHRNGSIARSSTKPSDLQQMRSGSVRSNSTYSRRGGRGQYVGVTVGMRSSHRSLTSIKSAGSTPHKRPVSRARRGVNFNHVRGSSFGYGRGAMRRGPASIAGDDTTYGRDHTSPTRPFRQPRVLSGRGSAVRTGTQSMIVPGSNDSQSYWNDELRQLSHSVAKDCDEAFSSSLLSPDSYIERDTTANPSTMSSSMLESTQDTGSVSVLMLTPTRSGTMDHESRRDTQQWDSRPLPRAPPPTESVLREIMLAKRRTAQRVNLVDESPNHVDRMMKHLDKLVPPGDSEADENHRTVSAPIFSQYSTQWGKDAIPLPSISEGRKESSTGDAGGHRTFSAPAAVKRPAQSTPNFVADRNGLDYLARQDNTIRLVMSPSVQQSPVKAPAPLNIRKKIPPRGSSAFPQPRKELNLRQQYTFDEVEDPISKEPFAPSADTRPGPVRKKSSWFKRVSKDKDDDFSAQKDPNTGCVDSLTGINSPAPILLAMTPTKKRSFSLAFWRNTRPHEEMKLSVAGKKSRQVIVITNALMLHKDVDFDDSPSPEPARMFSHPARPPHNDMWKTDVTKRNIESQQNWLARLFRVKPATEHLCFTISRRQTRQEIALLLREWRHYGIRDVQVDKDRNIIFGRVGQKNCTYSCISQRIL